MIILVVIVSLAAAVLVCLGVCIYGIKDINISDPLDLSEGYISDPLFAPPTAGVGVTVVPPTPALNLLPQGEGVLELALVAPRTGPLLSSRVEAWLLEFEHTAVQTTSNGRPCVSFGHYRRVVEVEPEPESPLVREMVREFIYQSSWTHFCIDRAMDEARRDFFSSDELRLMRLDDSHRGQQLAHRGYRIVAKIESED